MTRQEFEAGKVFKLYPNKYRYIAPSKGDDTACIMSVFGGESTYVANVSKITDEGCHFYGALINQSVEGYFEFSKCEIVQP